MARKNANSSPGVWLGLLLVLVAHTLAKSTRLEKVAKPEGFHNYDDESNYSSTVLRKVAPSLQRSGAEATTVVPRNVDKSISDDTTDLYTRKLTDEHNVEMKSAELSKRTTVDASSDGTLEKTNIDEIVVTVKPALDHSTLAENETIPTIATIDFSKHLTTTDYAGRVEETKIESEIKSADVQAGGTGNITINGSQSDRIHDNEGKLPTTGHEEFEFTGEHEDLEEHTSSELAEATTPSSKLLVDERQKIVEDSHKNIENFDGEHSDDHGNRDTISLVNDTNVNYHKYLKNDSGTFQGNDTSVSISENGVSSGHEPKHEVEIFKNVTHPSILRISEDIGNETMIGSTTPYYSSSRPKGRTISITDDNDLSTKKPKFFNYTSVEQTTSDTITKIFPKKSSSTEKPTELKPYPYVKSETKFTDDEIVTEISKNAEDSTEEISAYENTIGRKKSGEKIVVTEPSVLVENSIQQFKPIHDKRSGGSSRVNSTFDTPVASTAWSVSTTRDLASKNGTEAIQAPQTTLTDNGNRSQINNNVPQDDQKKSVTTERSPVILSEVTENNIEIVVGKINGTNNLTGSTTISKMLNEHSEVTVGDIVQDTPELPESQVSNSPETVETVSNRSSTINEIQTENEDSKTILDQLNTTDVTTEYPLSRENFSTEIYLPSTSNVTEKSSSEVEIAVSLPMTISTTTESVQETSSTISTSQSEETKPVEENVTNVTGLETIFENHRNTANGTEPTITQTTTVEYEFIELTTAGINFTVSESDVATSEKTDTDTNLFNETSQTTESQETVVADGSIEKNETASSRKIETVEPEDPISSTTPSFDTTTTSDSNSEVTMNEDLSNSTTSPVSESSLTTVTDVYTDTTLSSTSLNDKIPSGRVDVTTTGQSYDPEEITTTIIADTVSPVEEATTTSNIEVIVSSESTTASRTTTTVTQSTTTVQIQSTSELPEFPISSEDVTLFVRIVVDGSWSDICPVLSNLRQSLANLLTEGTERTVLSRNIILHQTQCSVETTPSTTVTPVFVYVVDDHGNFDYTMTEILPTLYKTAPFFFPLMIHSVEKLRETEPSNNAIAVVAVSSVAFICLVLLAGLLFIMRKRQTRFNYGERCRPVSLDAFRVDSVSAYNSVRRKGLTRASKRSYGNPAFEDSSVTPSHPLNFAGLSSFCNDLNSITEEFEGIPQVNARMDELPAGAEVKNRYANVAPLPETRVLLQKINNEPLTEYINASYVRGPKNATKYYIACQAPIESTVSDFWRMIWEQQSKVIIMLTDIIENGVEKCVEYIPPSEVTDCHRLYGDYQVTLKKREAKEKYAISTLHLKNLENNTYREVSHIWYLWPTNGVPSNGTGLIAILLEARALQRGAPGPIVVHCSPGTGRTGTLIALDLGIRQYEITRTVDVPRVVYTIRRDRAGAVQTKEQYAFIYKALNLYAAKLAGGALESM